MSIAATHQAALSSVDAIGEAVCETKPCAAAASEASRPVASSHALPPPHHHRDAAMSGSPTVALPITAATTLENLFTAHHALIYRTAYRVTGNASDAEDVLQTVFLRLAKSRQKSTAEKSLDEKSANQKSDEPHNRKPDDAKDFSLSNDEATSDSSLPTENALQLESYFRRAAVNAALDVIRTRARRQPAAPLDDTRQDTGDYTSQAFEVKTASFSNPQTEHETRELKQIVRRALAAMSNTAAQAFALKYFEDFTNREIAAALDTSPLVVGVMLHRARLRLQKDLRNYLESRT